MAAQLAAIRPAAGAAQGPAAKEAEPEAEHNCSPLFDADARNRLQTAVDHCNDVTLRYGIRVTSVNIISAMPKDNDLMTQLAAAAVAAAEAEKRELEARGAAKATLIAAEAEADSHRQRANGAKDAADTIASSTVAVEMERIRLVGASLSDKTTLFFGTSTAEVQNMMSNPAVVRR